MFKTRFISMLALLLTAATGAWADETLLLTIESKDNTDFHIGSKTFDDKVTITVSSPVDNDGDDWGWYVSNPASLTVAGTNGYTITSCKFYTQAGTAATGYTVEGESPSVYLFQGYVYTDDSKSVTIGNPGIKKIEVFGAAPAATGYTVSLKDGVKDADKWTVKVGDGQAQALPIGGLKGDGSETVTLQYTGRLKVNGVKATSDAAPAAPTYNETKSINDGPVTVAAGEHWLITGTGTPTSNAILIAAGATVTLDGVNISSGDYCIKCAGDATIILKDGSENTLTSSSDSYPALSIGDANTTLTIQGSTGVLNVTSGENCAGIGGGYMNADRTCGNIRIEGGVITAQGGQSAAGIGADCGPATCGDIIITGGTITAKGGSNAAGIGTGSGYSNQVVCGDITIANTVTKVTATKGENATHSIGKGYGGNATCGTVTIGGTKYWENKAAVGDGASYLATSPLIYDPAAPEVTYTLLSAATTADCGKVVCAAGHLHDAKTAVPDGCTAVGILGKVTETGHGLILALKNATSQTWNTINGWATASYAGTTLKVLPDDDARSTNLSSYETLGETAVSNWAVAQKSDYETIFTNLGSTKNSGGMTYDNNVNAYITTGVGGTAMAGDYWSATPDDDYDAWYFHESSWYDEYNTSTWYVRPVLGF